MALPPLKVKIGADTDGLTRGLGSARRAVAGFAVAAGAAFVGAAAGLAALTRQGLAAADAQAKLARSIDGTANGLRAVQLAGSDAGVSVGELNTAAQQLNRELARAAEGVGPAAEAMEKLGLNARRLQQLDVDQRLAAIADRAQELGLSAGETSDIMRDLGVRSRNMALLLIGGGDAIRAAREEVAAFGLELSETELQSIESANDAVSRMGLIFEGLSNQLAANIAPVLQTVADRFNALAQSDAAQEAVERIATSFGQLSETLLSEDFLGVAVSGMEALASVMGGVADTLVTVSQNLELVTAGLGAMAVAAAALGGPLTLVGGALAAALVGISTLRGRADDAAESLDRTTEAQRALNTILDTFGDTSGPDASNAALDLAGKNRDMADSALEAARANVALLESELLLQNQRNESQGFGNFFGEDQARNIRDDLSVARAELERIQELIAAAEAGGGISSQRPRPRPDGAPAGEDGDGEPPIGPGVPGADKVREQLEARLEALREGLLTEEEFLAERREEQLDTLRLALESEMLTEEEFRGLRERLEAEHLDRMEELRKRDRESMLNGLQGVFSNVASLMRTENTKLFRIGQAAAIANATVSGIRSAVEAWEWGMGIGGPPLAAAAAAASLARTGAMISQIASQSPSGGSGGGGAAAAGGGGAPQALPVQRVIIDAQGANQTDFRTTEALIETLNQGAEQGFRVDARLIGGAA